MNKNIFLKLYFIIILIFLISNQGFALDKMFLSNIRTDYLADRFLDKTNDFPTYIINFDCGKNFNVIKGKQSIFFKNTYGKNLEFLKFFLYPNLISENSLKIISVNITGTLNYFKVESGILTVTPSDKIKMNETIQLSIEFEISPQKFFNQQAGLIKQMIEQIKILLTGQKIKDFGIVSSTENTVSLGFSYPILISPDYYDDTFFLTNLEKGIGDFDFFMFSNYKVIIAFPKNYKALTSGVESNSYIRNDKKISINYGSFIRNFSIVLTKNFYHTKRKFNGYELNFYSEQNNSKLADDMCDAAVESVEYYNKSFGNLFFKNINIVETPLINGAGGCEFPGLIFMAKMLFMPNTIKGNSIESIFQKTLKKDRLWQGSLYFVLAHEIAHQWWNATVASNSVKFPFADEALANYSALKFIEHKYYKGFADYIFFINFELFYKIYIYLIGEDSPLNLPSYEYKDLLHYLSIVYAKGTMFYNELENMVGKKNLLNIIKKYYKKNYYSEPNYNDFLDYLRFDDKRMDSTINKWIYGK